MNTKEAFLLIEKANTLGSILGLETIKALLAQLGNPQNQVPVIHIAGTNGKGSILAFLESILSNAGYCVGRYISPTIFTYLERFQINGIYMTEEQFANYMTRVNSAIVSMQKEGFPHPTAFEIETAVSFLFFADEKVDVVLLETGMGGRLDATNVADEPLCTIIASISMDHMQFLGDTIEKIAYEKAGIIKENVPTVMYPGVKEAKAVIAKVCQEKHGPLLIPNQNDLVVLEETLKCSRFVFENQEYEISLLGTHQIYNAITAIKVIEVLNKTGVYEISLKQIKEGLAHTRWQGRFEQIGSEPLFFRDGAHNADACIWLRKTLEKHFTNKRILYIIGVLKDKEYEKMMEIMLPLAQQVFIVTPDNQRALDGNILADCAARYCHNVMVMESLQKAVEEAKLCAGKEDVILAFGSLSYIGGING